ncbi:hypothetical protein BCR33DRAFT_566419 [Rhizoclosmatium globosum]|uniref:Uncharacterized protein n=1 Tax=Rhizoclosmatium globosum TaxID=329046 RepID=A0A1Y2B6K0_9FUNG|nr:hypothetical protein BCR33DRAFT_566419 [Rhizoclosmatium globosum]|eukprot:ORY30469.1 hypothetical protein BCR33DRAFT_566419 [Rhizoclosmatium globosum]
METPYLWHTSMEDSTQNKNAYLSFISSNFGNFHCLRVYDGNHEDSNLRTSLKGIAHNGNVDCLISSTDAPERAVDTSHLLFVLRKPIDSDMKVTETELKLLAADVTSSYPVLAVVSDLNDSWKILWIQSKHDGRKVVSYVSISFTPHLLTVIL